MSRVDLRLATGIKRTARVQQVEGMYDIPSAAESVVEIRAEVNLDAKPWNIGLITGPSGCGKTSIALHLFGDALIEGYLWGDGAVVTEFDEALPIGDVIKALSSVGFSSPPAWLRPFGVLSNGERFRCNLARALVDPRPLVAIDEYTSVVHRKVAQIGSAAVAKHVRRMGRRFVAVSCHDDLVDWLQPDWILEPRPAPHVGLVAWRSVQPRPRIEMEIVRCKHAAWPWFAPHHYLTHELNKAAKVLHGAHRRNASRLLRRHALPPRPRQKNMAHEPDGRVARLSGDRHRNGAKRQDRRHRRNQRHRLAHNPDAPGASGIADALAELADDYAASAAALAALVEADDQAAPSADDRVLSVHRGARATG